MEISNWNFLHNIPVKLLLPYGEFLGNKTKLTAMPEITFALKNIYIRDDFVSVYKYLKWNVFIVVRDIYCVYFRNYS